MAQDDTPMLRVSVDGGRYEVIQEASGHAHAKRYGEPWRNLAGDNLVLSLAYELEAARKRIAALEKQIGNDRNEIPDPAADIDNTIDF